MEGQRLKESFFSAEFSICSRRDIGAQFTAFLLSLNLGLVVTPAGRSGEATGWLAGRRRVESAGRMHNEIDFIGLTQDFFA